MNTYLRVKVTLPSGNTAVYETHKRWLGVPEMDTLCHDLDRANRDIIFYGTQIAVCLNGKWRRNKTFEVMPNDNFTNVPELSDVLLTLAKERKA